MAPYPHATNSCNGNDSSVEKDWCSTKSFWQRKHVLAQETFLAQQNSSEHFNIHMAASLYLLECSFYKTATQLLSTLVNLT